MTDFDATLPPHGENAPKSLAGYERPTNVRWRILLLMMVAAALFHFNRVSITVAGSEHFQDEFSLTKTQLGAVYSAYLFVYTAFMLPGGWFIDRFGPKKALMVVGFGSAIIVPMTALTSFAPLTTVLLWLFLVRGLLGMISAPFHPGAARAVSFWLPASSRTTANGLITGTAVVGIAATYVVFGFMMDRLGWPLAFFASGVVTLLFVALWTIYAADQPRRHAGVNLAERALIDRRDDDKTLVAKSLDERMAAPPVSGTERGDLLGGLKAVFTSRSLLVLTASYAAYSYFQYLFFYWVQNYYDDVLNLTTEQSRNYATVTTIAMAFGMVLGGFSADRLQSRFGWRGRIIVPIGGMFASGILLVAGVLVTPPMLVVACFTGAMGVLGLAEAPFWMTGVEIGKRRGGLSGAFLNTGGNAGGIISPILTPLISELVGDWRIGMGLASIFCVVGALLWFGVTPTSPDRPRESLR